MSAWQTWSRQTSAFAIMLHDGEYESNARLRAKIEKKFAGSGHYKFSDHVCLVTGPRLATDVLSTLGSGDDESPHAAVFRLNGSFSGRSWTKLWDWTLAAGEG